MSIGDSQWLDWVMDEDQALPLLKAAYDRGLNAWDTANTFSNGASEQLIAKAIKKYSGHLEQMLETRWRGTERALYQEPGRV